MCSSGNPDEVHLYPTYLRLDERPSELAQDTGRSSDPPVCELRRFLFCKYVFDQKVLTQYPQEIGNLICI